MAFLTIVTDAGLAKIAQKIANQESWNFTNIKFSEDYADYDEKTTDLPSIKDTFSVATVSRTSETVVSVQGVPIFKNDYIIKMVGLYIDDDVLFSLYGSGDGIANAIEEQRTPFTFSLEIGRVPLDKLIVTPNVNTNLTVAKELADIAVEHTKMVTAFVRQEQRLSRLERGRL